MSKPKFTKGPWQANEKSWCHVASFFPVFTKDNAHIVACVNSNKKYDAALIAAAPEMYDLLKRIQGMLQFCELEDKINADTEHEIGTLLAKARGEKTNI